MNCKQVEELLSSYLDNELDRHERALIEEHLKTCRDCGILLSFLSETRDSLADFPELEVSGDLQKKLLAIPGKKKRFSLVLDVFLSPSLQPALAAATVILTMISFYVFNPDRKLIEESFSQQVHRGYSRVEKLYSRAGAMTDILEDRKDDILASLKNIKPWGETED